MPSVPEKLVPGCNLQDGAHVTPGPHRNHQLPDGYSKDFVEVVVDPHPVELRIGRPLHQLDHDIDAFSFSNRGHSEEIFDVENTKAPHLDVVAEQIGGLAEDHARRAVVALDHVVSDQAVIAQAIASGVVDGGYLGYTFGAQMERQGFPILADLAKLGIPYQGLGIMARRSLVDRSPDVAERALRAMVETIAFINKPDNKVAVTRSLAKGLRLQKVEDAEAGYEMMKTLYDRRIYPSTDGLRNVIRLLGKTNESIRRLKAEELIDDRIVRKLEREGLF